MIRRPATKEQESVLETRPAHAGGWLGLDDRVVVVTGGASGIGHACCEAFAANGARVVVADVDVTGASACVRLRRDHGVETLFLRTDISLASDAAGLAEAVVARFGRLDILINNAGVNIPRLLVDPQGERELSETIWDRMMGINVKGAYLCAQAAARAMLATGGGVIVNISSESGLEGSEGQSGYSAGKAALYGMTRSWAKEMGRRGVRVVGVAPGILEATGLRSPAYEDDLAYARGISVEKLRKGYVTSAIPLGRPGRLSEVADLVAFLASDRASYIHGTVVNISGGKSRE